MQDQPLNGSFFLSKYYKKNKENVKNYQVLLEYITKYNHILGNTTKHYIHTYYNYNDRVEMKKKERNNNKEKTEIIITKVTFRVADRFFFYYFQGNFSLFI